MEQKFGLKRIDFIMKQKIMLHNISYPASPAAVVFGVHLSARSRLTGIDRNRRSAKAKSPAIRPCA